MPPRALEGLTVLECGTLVSSAYTGKLLADLGADVIKVEEAGSGDEARDYGPFPGDVPDPERSGLFLYLNANKFGITLNLRSETGRSILADLAASAEVLLHDHPPPEAAELGLRYEALRCRNAGLVMLSISPFGATGPYTTYRGYEINAAALGGVVLSVGEASREPLYPAQLLGQFESGVAGAVGVLMACTAREQTGQGQHIDLSESDTWATMQMGIGVVQWMFGQRRTLRQGRRTSGGPYPHTMLPCKDGDFRIIAMTKREWTRFLSTMGDPDWGSDPRFQDRIKMNELHADELDDLIGSWLIERTKQELFETCYDEGLPFTPVKNFADVLSDPHLKSRGYFVEVEHRSAPVAEYPGRTYELSETPWQMRRPAPLLGEHNVEVYCNRLGMSRDDLVNLGRAGVA